MLLVHEINIILTEQQLRDTKASFCYKFGKALSNIWLEYLMVRWIKIRKMCQINFPRRTSNSGVCSGNMCVCVCGKFIKFTGVFVNGYWYISRPSEGWTSPFRGWNISGVSLSYFFLVVSAKPFVPLWFFSLYLVKTKISANKLVLSILIFYL